MHVEFRPVTDDIDAVSDWTEAVPADLLNHWRTSHPSQVRTLVAALSEDGTPHAVGLEVHRPTTAYAKLLPVWAQEPAAEAALVTAVEERASAEGAVVVKREFVTATPPAQGYDEVPIPTTPGPAANPATGTPYGHMRWLREGPTARLPYYRQTTDVTCGPVAVLLSMAGLDLAPEPTRAQELALWREATTMDGCDPLGLAVALQRRGVDPEVYLSTDDAILLELAHNEEQRELRRFIQAEFRRDAERVGVAVHRRAFTLDELDDLLDADGIAVVLIEELGMHPESCPHWVVVHSRDADVYYVQDPWTSAAESESWLDAHGLPIPRRALDRMAWYGKPAVRSMLAMRRP